MINIDSFCETIVRKVRSHFGADLSRCSNHPGHLSEIEQKRLLQLTPLACLTTTGLIEVASADTGGVQQNACMAMLFIDQQPRGLDPLRTIRNRVARLQSFLVSQKWGLDYTFPPMSITASDMSSLISREEAFSTDESRYTLQSKALELVGKLEQEPESVISVWAVTWNQVIVHQEDDTPVLFTKITQLNETDVSLPDIEELRIVNGFSQQQANGARLQKGILEITGPVGPDISSYLVYWADHKGMRTGDEKVAALPARIPCNHDLGNGVTVPRGAKSLMAIARGGNGTSESGAYANVADVWQVAPSLNRAVSRPHLIAHDQGIFLWDQVDGNGILMGETLDTISREWIVHDLSGSGLDSLVSAHGFGDKIWALGNQGPDFGFFAYDPGNDSWGQAPYLCNLSPSRVPMGGTILCGYGLVLCQNTAGFFETLLTCNLRSNQPNTGIWRSSEENASDPTAPTPPPFLRKSMGICVGENQLFLVGGESDSESELSNLTGYDPVSGIWQDLTPLPMALKHPSCIVESGYLFVLGGESNGLPSARLFRYSLHANSWEELAPNSTARISSAIAIHNGNLLVCGGRDANQTAIVNTEEYIPFYN